MNETNKTLHKKTEDISGTEPNHTEAKKPETQKADGRAETNAKTDGHNKTHDKAETQGHAQGASAKKPLLIDQLFSTWEKNTSAYFEKLLRNPNILETLGQVMNAGYKNKIYVDKTLHAMWKNLGLPNKRDQERTLHLLNELHSRIHDLEDQLTTLKQKNHEATPNDQVSRSTTTKSATQKAQTMKSNIKTPEETAVELETSANSTRINSTRTNSTRSNA